jgi:hypothetical protein
LLWAAAVAALIDADDDDDGDDESSLFEQSKAFWYASLREAELVHETLAYAESAANDRYRCRVAFLC